MKENVGQNLIIMKMLQREMTVNRGLYKIYKIRQQKQRNMICYKETTLKLFYCKRKNQYILLILSLIRTFLHEENKREIRTIVSKENFR